MKPASACGWWGDGEMERHGATAPTGPGGDAVPETVTRETAKLPGRSGYGIAIAEPGRAVPYLLLTRGRPIAGIRDLRVFGFGFVIDLGTPPETARLHRAESEAVGMRYLDIPVAGAVPAREQIDRFRRAVLDATASGPLLVYAPSASLLGTMWAFYRVAMGSSVDFAVMEARALGLTPAQEKALRNPH